MYWDDYVPATASLKKATQNKTKSEAYPNGLYHELTRIYASVN